MHTIALSCSRIVAMDLTAFAAALRKAREQAGISQRAAGKAVGLAQPTYSAYEVGSQEPARETVFALEELLGVPPGALSRHLGYLPASWQRKRRLSFAEFVQVEERDLSEEQRELLLRLYREFTGG